MLYPNFDDLVSFKDQRSDLKHPAARKVKSSLQGNYHSPFRGQGLEFDSVREYVPGDDIRHIDWRVTARSGSPHIKLFREERERHIVLCVDMNTGMRFGTKNTFKSVQAAHAAAILGWKGVVQHDRVSACLFGDIPQGIQFFSPKRSQRSLCSIFKLLSEPVQERNHVLLEEALAHISHSVHTGSLIYLISDFMDLNKDKLSVLSLLSRRCDVIFVSINDPADHSLFPVGTIGFCLNESDKIFVNTNDRSGRENYSAQWIENRKALYEITSRLKISLIELTTESDVHADLLLGLKHIAKRKRK